MPVTLHLSTDTGAPTIARTAGQLTTALDECLVLQRCFAFDGAVTYTDNSVEARLLAGSTFTLLPGPFGSTSGQSALFSGQAKFAFVKVKLDVVGVGGTYVFEYSTGAGTWAALVSPTDGTSGLTADGALSWSIAAQPGWVTATYNSITGFWVRIRCTGNNSTNPTCKSASIYGWAVAYTATNIRTYQSVLTSGVRHWFTVNDASPAAGTGQEAAWWGDVVDPGSAAATPGVTNSFPTSGQKANGLCVRKSDASDTAKVWFILMDEKSVYLGVQTLDTASTYLTYGFGEFYSLLAGDVNRSFVNGRLTFASTSTTLASVGTALGARLGSASLAGSVNDTTYVAKTYLGTGASLAAQLATGMPYSFWGTSATAGNVGSASTFNGPDGGVFVAPVFVCEAGATSFGQVRGRLRGIWDWGQAGALANNGDTYPGNGALVAKTFRAFKICNINNGAVSGFAFVLVGEVSDTWEVN